jgi:hypothetical protein
MEYIDGNIYEGEFDNKLNRNGIGILRYKNGDVYNGEWKNNKKNGKGFIYLNEKDYEIINNNILLFDNNNIKEIFKLNIRDYVFIGNFINDEKKGKGILFMKYKENFLTIFIGEFNDKEMNGIIYFMNGLKNDNIIDETKIGKIYINILNKISKKLKSEEWFKFIKKKF